MKRLLVWVLCLLLTGCSGKQLSDWSAFIPEEEKRLVITHCNAPDRAEQVKKMILEKVRFRECIIMDMRGVSTMYANDGGVIVTA